MRKVSTRTMAALLGNLREGIHEILEAVAVAGCALEVEGADLDELFETAAAAVNELMVDPATAES